MENGQFSDDKIYIEHAQEDVDMTDKKDMTVEEYIESNDERRNRHKEYLNQFLSNEYGKDNDLLLKVMGEDESKRRDA